MHWVCMLCNKDSFLFPKEQKRKEQKSGGRGVVAGLVGWSNEVILSTLFVWATHTHQIAKSNDKLVDLAASHAVSVIVSFDLL